VSGLLAVSVFALGVHLAIRTVAALYRVVDLWYARRTAYPLIVRGVAGWVGATVAIGAILGTEHRAPFLWGLIGFLVWYLALYAVRPLIFRRRETT
jgi:hypothetical protein